MSKRSDLAAALFQDSLFKNLSPDDIYRHRSCNLDQVGSCISAAFQLYEDSWGCHDHDIREWRWPYMELDQARKGQLEQPFDGDRPWDVLLRHAWVAVRQCEQEPPHAL